MNLRERLSAMASFVLPHARVADIGTDHAYLPIHLAMNQHIDYIVAGEVNPGPYRAAQESIARLGLEKKIFLRFGDGLSVVRPSEVDTATIAGMGGQTIVEILAQNIEVTHSIRRFILQPMIAASYLRSWLINNGWYIIDEELVLEDGKLYEIIVAEQGKAPLVEEILLEVGPLLWKKKHGLLAVHLDNLIAQSQKVLKEMARSPIAQKSDKYQAYIKKANTLEEMRGCL